MAGAFVKAASGTGTANPTTTAAFSGSTTSGNLIVVTVSNDSGLTNQVTSVTDSKGNTYTEILDVASSSVLSMWYAANVTGGASHTVTANWDEAATGQVSLVAQEFSGIATASPLDKSTSAGGTSTTPSSGATATLAQADELVVGGVSYDAASTTVTAGSTYTNATSQAGTGANAGQESKAVAATTAVTATFTLGASRTWVCGVATFKAAASAVNANAEVASSTGTALAPGEEAASQPAGQAATTGTALAPGEEAVSQPAGQATATGTAQQVTVQTAAAGTANAELASATGTALAPGHTVGQSAAVVTVAGSAHVPEVTISGANPATATATGTAQQPAASISQPAQQATATGTAQDTAAESTSPLAGQATATGTALAPTVVVTGVEGEADAEPATATGTAGAPGVSAGQPIGQATATGTAQQPTHTASSAAAAEAVSVQAVGRSPGKTLLQPAGQATATGAATALTASGTQGAGQATATGAASSPAAEDVSQPPGGGAAAGAALAPSFTLTGHPNGGGAVGAASRAEPALGQPAGAVSASGTAYGLGALSDTGIRRVSSVGIAHRPQIVITGSRAPAGSAAGWNGLIGILRSGTAEILAEMAQDPTACPNDGEPLVAGPDGVLFCRFDGWRPSL